jgi:hypothetical protein
MGTFHFNSAKLKRLNWNDRLRKFPDGKEQVPEGEMLSPKDCELGKWIYADRPAKYGQFPEMKTLETVHRETHALAKQIVQSKTAGDKTAAEKTYQKILAASGEIVGLIDETKKEAA